MKTDSYVFKAKKLRELGFKRGWLTSKWYYPSRGFPLIVVDNYMTFSPDIYLKGKYHKETRKFQYVIEAVKEFNPRQLKI